ncbi:MAG: class II aldolase/adducin family protein [Alphaproteobacteria bacterium]|nr:class II aldolase/adducin family protein [Alphaproteobacteria bacterium]
MSALTAFRAADVHDARTERDVRVQLAACYRLIKHFGMDDLVFTHITARVPGQPGIFLINPYGLMFDEITSSNLVKIDYEGNLVEPSPNPVNKAGFIIHSAIHRARKDVNFVLHTHTRAGMAVSCVREGLLPLNQFALQFYGQVAYHDYEGVASEIEERERLVAALGDKNVLILRSHGLLTCGETAAQAFSLMYNLEQSCRVQVDVKALGGTMIVPPLAVRERTASQFNTGPQAGQREWPALIRMLDRIDPSYRN